ncbi:hypothetical protein JI435_423160 [Parastagonospora nodorum SN15]|uniref:Uncharacterized protein n=1 Tax=Phaeosphaeria nodorum (strain SN15 / ATCC MYA-4574 / FGSC 10173) TaxID=321614 RepID=A0A7U2IAI1_PHANO|nr:hypothetical protein JI435_423160 [Parastagonospora nodorum SN15]
MFIMVVFTCYTILFDASPVKGLRHSDCQYILCLTPYSAHVNSSPSTID